MGLLRHRRIERVLVATLLAPLLVVGTASGAYADDTVPVPDTQVDLSDVGLAPGEIEIATQYAGAAAFVVDSDVVSVPEPPSKVVTVTDELGNVLSQTRSTPAVTAVGTGKYACVLSGSEIKKKGIIAHRPSAMGSSDRGLDLQYVVHPYQSNFARQAPGGLGWTWQVEMCIVGGAQTFESWRLLYTAAGVTAPETYQSRIGANWSKGTDEPTIEATLSMDVASPDPVPVSIGATATQKATGVNGGSAGTRMPQSHPSIDQWKHNAALSRWDHVCAWYNQGAAKLACGSKDYQASITHALYEWPRTNEHTSKTIRYGAYGNRRCGSLMQNCPR